MRPGAFHSPRMDNRPPLYHPQRTIRTGSQCGSNIRSRPLAADGCSDSFPNALLFMPSDDLNSESKLIKRVHRELIDDYDEELEMERDDWEKLSPDSPLRPLKHDSDLETRNHYFKELFRLQGELVKMHDWVVESGHRLVIVCEGRDAAGKGGVIKRITQRLNPRVARVAALPAPSNREKTQWYFQRYVAHLPAAGEIVLFDRSWYNRAGVERVMGFCTEAEYFEFLHSCPQFERMLARAGIILNKYWFSVSDEEQERRFQQRIKDPTKRWKLSPMDLESRRQWVEYSRAKDEMFAHTDIKQIPWYVVNADNKKSARLNVIRHQI